MPKKTGNTNTRRHEGGKKSSCLRVFAFALGKNTEYKVVPQSAGSACIEYKVSPQSAGSACIEYKVTPQSAGSACIEYKVTPQPAGRLCIGYKMAPQSAGSACIEYKVTPQPAGREQTMFFHTGHSILHNHIGSLFSDPDFARSGSESKMPYRIFVHN